ncbi:MAG: hypothetical protein HY903_19945 [Deltaproteobacteria bacterium]|nr:hypothetical protein [Deltaproteobacteria bacterium]
MNANTATRSLSLLSAMLVAAGVCAVATPARAQWKGHEFGLGLRLGDPTAFSGKLWLNGADALQVDFGWHTAYHSVPHTYYYYYAGPVLSVDWVHQVAHFGPASRKVWFGVHLGVGGTFDYVAPDSCYYDALGQHYCASAMTVHAPVAFNVYLAAVRLEFFAEVAPGLRILPGPAPSLIFSVGGRYYF